MRRKRQVDGLSIELTPMIDVVFLLITFFLVVGALVNEELAPLHLPPADIPTAELAPDALIVNVDRSGRTIVHGHMHGSSRQLRAALALARERGARRVLIRADQDVVYDVVQRVMIACTRERLRAVELAAAAEAP